jgi:hypothetical protein
VIERFSAPGMNVGEFWGRMSAARSPGAVSLELCRGGIHEPGNSNS